MISATMNFVAAWTPTEIFSGQRIFIYVTECLFTLYLMLSVEGQMIDSEHTGHYNFSSEKTSQNFDHPFMRKYF